MRLKEEIREDLKMWKVPMENAGKLRIIWRAFVALFLFPGFASVFLYRLNRRLLRFPRLARLFQSLRFYIFSNDISYQADIGPGLKLAHVTNIVIGAGVVVGAHCIIYNDVTLGAKRFDEPDRKPRVGNDVTIGTGAKVLGPIEIGDGAQVGALTLCDVSIPKGALAIGNPAIVKER